MDYQTLLEKQIKDAQDAYDRGHPVCSDAEFDKLVAQLVKRAPESQVLNYLGRPVGQKTLRHDSPMLSLQKEYTIDKVLGWAKRAALRERNWIIQPKVDGVALSIVFKDGVYTAATRGDGNKGDVVPQRNLATFVPPRSTKFHDCTVRGEVVMPVRTFREKYADKFANPRNLIAGALSSTQLAAVKVLEDSVFLAYSLFTPSPGIVDDLAAHCAELDDARWVVPHTRFVSSFAELRAVLEELIATPPNLIYEIDGWVVKLNDRLARDRLGNTSHHPRWSMALKLQGNSGASIVREVVWETSRSGTVTPVVVMDPVKLSGASVTRATLHHAGFFDQLQLRVGSEIVVTRRGGVIPHVEGVKSMGGGKPFVAPKRCDCGRDLVRDGLLLECRNKEGWCKPQACGSIEHWFKTVGALGIGPEVVAKMYELGHTDISELYEASELDWTMAVGAKTARKLLAEIDRTKDMAPATFLAALGIPHCGPTRAAQLLAKAPDALVNPSVCHAEFEEVFGAVWRGPFGWIDYRQSWILLLMSHVRVEATPAATGPFAGWKVVFTGALTDMDRETARAQARSLGAKTPTAVTMQTTHLVVGDGARDEQSGKRDKARKYQAKGSSVKILTEAEWSALVAEAQPE